MKEDISRFTLNNYFNFPRVTDSFKQPYDISVFNKYVLFNESSSSFQVSLYNKGYTANTTYTVTLYLTHTLEEQR